MDEAVVISVDMNVSAAEKEVARLKKKIAELQTQIKGMENERAPIVEQLERLTVQLDAAKEKLYEMQNATRGAFSAEQIDYQKETVTGLQARWDELAGRVEKYDKSIETANGKLADTQNHANAAAVKLKNAADNGERLAESGKKGDSAFSKFEKRIMGLAKRVLIFSLITKALRSLRSYIGDMVKENADAAAAIENLKAAFEGLVQPIVNALIPALVFFLNILTNVVNTLASLVGGTKYATSGLGKEEKELKGVGGAASKAAKSLASFDEINQLSGSSGGGGGGAGGGEAPNFAAEISPELMSVGQLFTGIALVALGAILTFSGSVPVGLAMMVAGGLMVYGAVKENWGYISSALQGQLGAVVAIVSTALLAIGAVLAFSGTNVPVGIGLMIAGAAGLAAAVAVNWGSIVDAMQGSVGAVTAIIGGALLVIGAILAFSGANIPLGIGLMVAGGLALGSAVAVNWNSIVEILAGVWNAIKTGVTTAWNAIVTFLTNTWSTIKTGAVNAWNGLTGAFSTASTWFYNNVVSPIANFFVGLWEKLKTGATSAWDGIMSVFGTVATFFQLTFSRAWRGIVNIFSVAGEIFTDIKDGIVTAFKTIVNALIKGINKVIAIPFNAINSVLKKIHDVDILGVKPFKWVGTIAVPEIPLLAQGAVIPPNKEFLAMLGDQKSGTNIETPLATMVQAFRTALTEMGYGGGQEAVMVVDGEVFGKLAYKLGGKEQARVGVSLAGGATV